MRRFAFLSLAVLAAACGGSSGTGPTPGAAVLVLAASPNPTAGAPCAGCGAESTDRWSVTQLTIQETAGVGVTVTAIAMTLRENGTNAVIASGEFDTAAVASLAGSARVAGSGTIVARNVGVHYAREQAGRAATLTYTVRARDDNGNAVSRDLAVPVSAT